MFGKLETGYSAEQCETNGSENRKTTWNHVARGRWQLETNINALFTPQFIARAWFVMLGWVVKCLKTDVISVLCDVRPWQQLNIHRPPDTRSVALALKYILIRNTFRFLDTRMYLVDSNRCLQSLWRVQLTLAESGIKTRQIDGTLQRHHTALKAVLWRYTHGNSFI